MLTLWRLPSAKRAEGERKSQDAAFHDATVNDTTFLEDTIRTSLMMTLPFAQLGMALTMPVFGSAMLASNALSYAHERKINACRKSISKTSYETSLEACSEKAKPNRARSTIIELVKKPRNLINKASVYAASYAFAGSLALLTNAVLPDKINYDPDLVNNQFSKCSVTINDKTHEFGLMEEVHFYNFSSSEFSRRVIESNKFTVLLTEGVLPPAEISERKLSEKIAVLGMAPLVYGAGWNHDSVHWLFKDKNKPAVYLEKRADDGSIERLGNIGGVAMGIQGAMMMAAAPAIYFTALPFRFSKYPEAANYFSGIFSETDDLMSANARTYFLDHSNEKPLLVLGKLHAKSFIKLLGADCLEQAISL